MARTEAAAAPADILPMLATLVDSPFSDPGWVFEPKYDGVRALAYLQSGPRGCRLVTRNGNEVSHRYPELAALPGHVKGDVVLDGEIVSLDEHGRPSFQQLQGRLGLTSAAEIQDRARRWPVKFAVFDVLWYDGQDVRPLPLGARRKILELLVSPGGPLILAPQVEGDGEALYKEALVQGLEGIIAKDRSSPYEAGRSRRWLKIKTVHRQEVVIGGWTDPRGDRPLLGALAVGLYGEDGRLHWIGNVGGGFTHESLEQVHRLLQPLATDTSPFAERPLAGEPLHYVRPRLVCEVKFGEWTREGHLRQPIFEGLRDDKDPRECTLEQAHRTEAVVGGGADLAAYRDKRDFTRTPEPAPAPADERQDRRRAQGPLRFVVQEHHASVLHYDFRLEIGGALKSWSVPKGPSLDPKVKRLAVQVEDHPLDYLTFTGTIPEGGYGAGTVYRWDLGTFEPLDADPLAAWRSGSLRFRLDGQRLKGEWHLFEMKGRQRGGKPQWLLVKAADQYAVPGHEAERVGDAPLSKRGRGAVKKPESKPKSEPKSKSKKASPRTSTKASPRASTKTAAALSLDEFLALQAPKGDVTVDLDGVQVELTSLERTYWPKEKITKFDLLAYYARMWPYMGPFLRDRPAILQRYPRGIGAPKFFQHDLKGVPDYIQGAALTNGEGRVIDYAVYTTLPSLLYLANLGTIEHHPWSSTIAHLDRPDWLILDLDPGEAPWESVVQVALEAGEVCAGHDLHIYPKTSGSRGIHLYLPLRPEYSYEEVAGLAHELAQEISARVPELATVERSLAGRTSSQVYVDWLQNARGKSVAAPYTVRARPGAPVSMPLTFEQVQKGVRIADFTLRDVPGRIGELPGSSAWAGFFEDRQALPAR